MKALALHGFLGCGADWDDFVGAVRPRRPRLAWQTPDLPGHGREPAPVPATFAQWVDWTRAQLTGPTHLLGYSLGGRLALAATLAEGPRGRVRSLTLLSAAPGLATADERASRIADDDARAARLAADGLPSFLREWYRQPLFAPLVERSGIDALIARRGGGDAHALAATLRSAGTGAMGDLRSRLPGLTAPVLVMAGARDEKYVALGRETAGAARAARFVALRDVGHSLLLEAPSVASAHWCDFLEEIGHG